MRSAFTLSLIALLLASCDLLSFGPFPDFVTSLEGSIRPFEKPAGDADHWYTMSWLSNGEQGYLFLIRVHEWSPAELVIIDGDFTVRERYSGHDVFDLFFVDANGDFVVGARRYSPEIEYVGDTGEFEWHESAVAAGARNYALETYDMPPTMLSFPAVTEADWSPLASGSLPADVLLDESGSAVWLEDAVVDPKTGLAHLLLNRDGEYVVLSVDQAEIPDFPNASGTALLSVQHEAYNTVAVPDVDRERVHILREGVVYRDYDGRAELVGYDGETVWRREEDPDFDALEAYDLAGTYRYVLDRSTEVLYKTRMKP